MAKQIDRLADEVYKIVEEICRTAVDGILQPLLTSYIVVMTMMRMVVEVVMVIAIVAGMVFMMKVSAKEDNSNKTLPDNGDDNEDDRKSK